ncbi:TldD/PmbA family protein [Anaerotignum sp. MB30-C6]|uniref:TldD/PmbA family protein n=1 Tax=Anaerotignum sp. MB30-C6 TaxID=3070814 RepID=UPI0027DB1B91|nr:TldD/PmbA family protein [Anaerotignum sp. MB30-C6]WMI81405.1 TldD/PmbA family protein [Anaerotignum sp. MB30-C6]
MDRQALQNQIIKEALEQGFTDCEVFYLGGESFEVLLMEGEVSNYENSSEGGVSFRGTYEGRTGYAFSERLEEDTITFLIEAAKENAMLMAEEEREELFGGEDYPEFNGYYPELEQVCVEKRIQLAKRMEEAALNGAESVASLDYCVLGIGKREVAIANSLGLNISYTKNFASGYVSAIAKSGDETKKGSAFWKGTNWADFDPEETGRKAARRGAALLGAGTVDSGTYTAVLDGKAMTALLSSFSGVFFAENVQKGFSLLKDKVGEKVAADCITLRDDALLEGGYASVPFDSEGVAGKNKEVIEHGRLKTFLYNLKSAKKDGVRSTGNGFKAGLTAPVKTACTNFYIQKGENSLDELISTMGNGLYVTDFMGLHAGTNAVSGDFSLSAEGFYVENGRIVNPVEQITIAGNFYALLLDVLAVGDDLYYASSGKGSPSVLAKNIAVAGK